MGISSHLGIVLLVITGIVTVIGVIIIATIEVKRSDSGKTAEAPADKKKG